MMAAVALAWVGPMIAVLFLDEEFARTVWDSHRPLAPATYGALLVMALVYMASMRHYAVEPRLHPIASAVLAFGLLMGVFAGTGGSLFAGRTPAIGPMGAALLAPVLFVVFDTLRRPALPTHSFVGRIAVCAVAFKAVGVLFNAHYPRFYSSCWGPAGDATWSATTSESLYAERLLLGATPAALAAGAAIVGRLRHHRRGAHSLWLLLGLAGWLTALVISDLLAQRAASEIAGPREIDVAHLDALALLAGWAHSVANAIAFSTVVLVTGLLAFRSGRQTRALRRSWAMFWPLLPALWLLTAQLHEPPLALTTIQAPSPVWEDLPDFRGLSAQALRGSSPSFQAWSPYDYSALLDSTGTLHVFHEAHVWTLPPAAGGFIVPTSDGLEPEFSLLVDQRVTLGQLRRALSHLEKFERVTLVWRTNDVHRAAQDTHRRWRFLTLSSYALGGTELIRYDSLGEDMSHMDGVSVSDWLAHADDVEGGLEVAVDPLAHVVPYDDSRGVVLPRSVHSMDYPSVPRALPEVLPRDVGMGLGAATLGLLAVWHRGRRRPCTASHADVGPYRASAKTEDTALLGSDGAGARLSRVGQLAWRVFVGVVLWALVAVVAFGGGILLGLGD